FRSLAYSLSFRSTEGTLTDTEVDEHIEAIVTALKELNCHLR
nr:hypothetical protein [Veillonella sp.]